jgi:hypothetical protein
LALGASTDAQARTVLKELEKTHAARRTLVWAEMGQAQLAKSLKHLAVLAEITKQSLAGGTLDDVETSYTTGGWKADDAVLPALGPRGTGKSHLFQQVSPYSHLISGGKATVAKMFVNNSNGQRGLVCQYDVVCFDEVSGISFDQKDGVNIMKGYMESGEFSRGKESIRADGSIVLVGNFEVDVEHQQRIGHLFGPMPPEMKDDTAFMDRIYAFLPGWDVPKINKAILTSHFGLVSDFLSECWSHAGRHPDAAGGCGGCRGRRHPDRGRQTPWRD